MSNVRKLPQMPPDAREVPSLLLGKFDLTGSVYHVDQFIYDYPKGYLYMPQPDARRRVVLFHASACLDQYVTLMSREERMDMHWRKNTRGPGFYAGSTPHAAASSMVSKDAAPRVMQAFLTEPIALDSIQDRRHDPSYFMPMIRAQFSEKQGDAFVQAHTEHDDRDVVQVLSPGLVSRAKTDGFISGSLAEGEVEANWLRLVAQPESAGRQRIERIGVLEDTAGLLEVEQGIKNHALFAAAAVRRVVQGAIQ